MVPNPSLITYNNLQVLYLSTLRCSCSVMTIPYRAFITLSPTLHQICSSDFVSEPWISIMSTIKTWVPIDWRNQADLQFQLLLNLCQSANKTIDDAVRHFIEQFFVTSSVLTEIEFNTQLNATLNQFFRSTVVDFHLFVAIARLLVQVDQPYMGSTHTVGGFNANLIGKIVKNETNGQQSLQVCRYSKQ